MVSLSRFLIVLVCLAVGAVASADDKTTTKDRYLNRDQMPTSVRVASASDWRRAASWLDSAGLGSDSGLLASDLFRLQMGLRYPMSDNLSLMIGGSAHLQIGVTFH